MKRKSIMLVLTMGMLFTGCGNNQNVVTETQVFQGEAEQSPQIEETLTEETVQQETEVSVTSEHFEGASDESLEDIKYVYEYDMPQITISGNAAAQEKIQKDLEDYVTDFVNSLSQNEFGYIGYVDEGKDEVEPSYQNLSMSVIRADSQVISIMMSNEGYDHGAHGWMNVAYFNYFTSTGDKITFDALGDGFRDRAEALVTVKAAQIQQEEEIFFPDYQNSISLVVVDGTENQKELYSEIYGDMEWSDNEEFLKMTPTFYVTDTGFGFTSGQYVLQPYAGGIVEFTFTAADFDGTCTADIFTDEGALKKTIDEELVENIGSPITVEEFEQFTKTADAAEFGDFDDFSEIMNQNFYGTWYDPEMGEAIRLTSVGAYVYIPYLDMYGDYLYNWKLIDRSEKGLCPELLIYDDTEDPGVLAYYVAGIRDNYFWCNLQSQVFYKQ